jgi:CelD/BcsL family acetyltransferase involved in cellulose biosynthesis
VLRAEIIDDERALQPVVEEWDALAVACAKPFSAPAWMLAWWRHVAPPGSSLRVAQVRDGSKLVAVAPFYRERSGPYRLLGRATSYRPDPVGRPEHVAASAAGIARSVRELDGPAALFLEGMSPGSPWPRALADAWQGGAWLHRDRTTPAPVIDLQGRTFEQWMASRPRRFRDEARRRRRRIEERGATFRLAEEDADRSEALDAFARLHHARWQRRGGSKALDRGVESLLRDAASELGPGRFRLWTMEVDGGVVSAHVFLAAGGEVTYWLGGFDEAWARFAPANLVIIEALRHSFETGDRRLDLGGGDQDYKRRLADGEDRLEWWTIVPRGPGYPLARLRLLPRQAYRAVAARIPAETKARIDRRWRVARRRSPGS